MAELGRSLRAVLLGTVLTLAAAAPQAVAATAGDLDGSFGSGGLVITPAGDGDDAQGNALLLRSDGTLVVAGSAVDGSVDKIALARYAAGGSLTGLTLTPAFSGAGANALTAQGTNLIVAGQAADGGANKFMIARYSADGVLDSGFAGGGIVATAAGDGADATANAVATTADAIFAAGTALDSGKHVFAFARYSPSGSPDSGVVPPAGVALNLVGDGGDAMANAVAPVAGGKVVLAGTAKDAGIYKLAIARLNQNGTLDSSFGTSAGTTLVAVGDGGDSAANALAVLPDGRLLTAGYGRDSGVSGLALAMFTPEGQPDAGFGIVGRVFVPLGGDQDDASANAVSVMPDGRIVVAGTADDRLVVARFLPGGAVDTSFGAGGSTITALGADDVSAAQGVVVLPDTRIVVAGSAEDEGIAKLGLARYIGKTDVPPGGDHSKPLFSRVSVTNKRFRVGKTRTALSARKKRKKAKVGTQFRYTLSEQAKVTIAIQRGLRGVKKGKRCLKPARKLKGKRCTRWVKAVTLIRKSVQGRNKVPFSGRTRRGKLKPGSYRAVLRAVDAAGNLSSRKILKFKVVRR